MVQLSMRIGYVFVADELTRAGVCMSGLSTCRVSDGGMCLIVCVLCFGRDTKVPVVCVVSIFRRVCLVFLYFFPTGMML